jgi:hypothetical protein
MIDIHPPTEKAPKKKHIDRRTEILLKELASFNEFGLSTRCTQLDVPGFETVPVFTNEFWTSKQRAASSLHEVSYRACFKPQLPRFFVERLTTPGEVVYDPFMGRGTTVLEAAILGRKAAGCDANPLSRMLVRPRLSPPSLESVHKALQEIDWSWPGDIPQELLAFYHHETLREICALRKHLNRPNLSQTDDWIRMVATNRLTGHSKGFFSVYTLPPNQAVSVKSQIKINEQRKQTPDRRIVSNLIFKKSKSLLSDIDETTRKTLHASGTNALLMTGSCADTPLLKSGSVSLAVTSPPFLDTVDYASDNWLRCWFTHIETKNVEIWILKNVLDWAAQMSRAFSEMRRILKPGGFIAFEVGEVRNGRVKLEEFVVPAAAKAGLTPMLVLINDQEFTKTSNCWGVTNRQKGTNTNRIVLLRKD